MNRMLDYIQKIKEVNTDGVEPLTDIFSGEDNVFREDMVNDTDIKKNLIDNAPQSEGEYLVVPKTV